MVYGPAGLVGFILLGLATVVVCEEYKRVCYFTNWAQYRAGDRRFTPANITDVYLCTHIIFAFASVEPDNNTIIPNEHNDDGPGGNFEGVTQLRLKNPDLKVLLAVGGWTHGVKSFVEVVSSDARIEAFCDNIVTYLTQRNFDGIDLDWEYPAHRGGTDSDRERFTVLIETLRQKFEVEAVRSGKPRMLISTAAPAQPHIGQKAYEIEKLGRVLDFVNLMAYDFDVFREGLYYVAGLYGRPEEAPPINNTLNVHSCVQFWLANGMPREKLMLGMPLYGREFTVSEGSTLQYGEYVNTTETPAVAVIHNIICDRLREDWTHTWDDVAKVAIMTKGQKWLSYDDMRSYEAKVNYIKNQRLGGFMVWEISLGDFAGIHCRQGAYFFLNRIKQMLSTAPEHCPLGQEYSMTSGSCVDCPVNFYRPDVNLPNCLKCPSGHVTKATGSRDCVPPPVQSPDFSVQWPEQVDYRHVIGGAVGAPLFLIVLLLVVIIGCLYNRNKRDKYKYSLEEVPVKKQDH